MSAPPRSIPITVLAGQSNANSVGLGQAVFGQVAAEGGLYVHTAVNGSPLAAGLDRGAGDWNPSGAPGAGELLASLMSQIAAMLDPRSPSYVPGAYLDKVIWVQGEADTWLASAAANYQRDMAALHKVMTDRFGVHDLVISALSDAAITGTATSDSHRRNWATVQAAQRALDAADGTISLVDPDVVAAKGGYGLWEMLRSDHLHYNSASGYAAALGRALAAAGSDGASALALPPPPGTSPHYAIGGWAADRLTLAATGLGQAFGSGGTDTLTLTGRTDGVQVFRAGMDALRVVANGGAAFMLDLVSIESLVLTVGADKVVMSGGLTRVDAGAGHDNVNGLTGNDTMTLGAGNDLAHAGSGQDLIYAGDGADWVFGSLGNDTLSGDASADRLYGGDGNDRLLGGTANDLLTGDAGADVFAFASGAGSDHITDFQNGFDRIEMRGIAASAVKISALNGDTVIRYGADTLILDDISATLITLADFTFA